MPTALRLDMTGHADDERIESARDRAALEMASLHLMPLIPLDPEP